MQHTPRHPEGLRLLEIDLEADLEPLRVIVAIEDRELRRQIAFVLRADGYEVLPLRSREALVGHLRSPAASRPPDLVVFAADTPHETARAVVDALRRHDAWVPIVVISGHPHELPQAAAVFRPGFDLDDLRTAVANIIPAEGA